jgi:hypothetical protein
MTIPDLTPETTDDSGAGHETKRKFGWKRLPFWARIAIPVTGAVVAAGIVFGTFVSTQPSELENAVVSCELEDKAGAQVGDEGQTLTLDMAGEDEFGKLSYDEVFCVLDAIEVPDRVTAQMGETRSLDGRQTAEWNDVTASWGYHPDSGLDLILALD